MDNRQIAPVLLDLIDKLDKRLGWVGETHAQKAVYFLQELCGFPSSFNFIMYKFGPFSFELRDELARLRSEQLLTLTSRSVSNGPSLEVTPLGQTAMARPGAEVDFSTWTDYVAEQLGSKTVRDLERIGTALFVTLRSEGQDARTRAEQVHKLKGHVSLEEAEGAIEAVDVMRNEFALLQRGVEGSKCSGR